MNSALKQLNICLFIVILLQNHGCINGFTACPFSRPSPFKPVCQSTDTVGLLASRHEGPDEKTELLKATDSFVRTGLMALTLAFASWAPIAAPQPAFAAADPGKIVGCLFQKCRLPLAKCISNPKCLANVICINTCNGKEDETGCQIQCGDLFENEVVGEFNKCAVSDMSCVPQEQDRGEYPVPKPQQVVKKFDTNFFNGRLYITAGLNPLFDTFPCQVHFFTETSPGKFYGKLNWNIVEPDGEFFTRDALQRFVQDKEDPSHMINHDNEYLHYQDDWWIIDYAEEGNEEGTPPFAFVYYRGSNDAWDGYGGAVIYTKDSKLPMSLEPRLRAAAAKVNKNWDDFIITDNSCPSKLSNGEALVAKEQFAGSVLLQTEKQLQAQATRFRGTAANSIKAQLLFFNNEATEAQKAFEKLNKSSGDFEDEATGKVY